MPSSPRSWPRRGCAELERLGIVDLGSGTSRLVVYAYQPGIHYRLIDEIRESLRLAEGLAETGRLSPLAQERALSALRLYADFARATGLPKLKVIATSALREAANREEFLRQVEALGLEVQVIGGEEEAALGVRAVANSFALEEAWVVDLGGGSLQLSRMIQRSYAEGSSYPLGALRLSELFLSDPPKKSEVQALRAEVRRQLRHTLAQARAEPFPLVAMGGSARALARMLQKLKAYPLDLVHQYFVDREELSELNEQLLSLTTKERVGLAGLQEDRADTVVAAGLVYQTLLEEGGWEGFWVSGQGIREGLFYESFLPPPHLIPEVRRFAVDNLLAHYPQDPRHIERVRAFARTLFEDLRPLHRLDARAQRLLDDSAILHDIGMSVGYYDHHKHGAYLILSGALPGLSHAEQALLALLVRYHRKGEPQPGAYRKLLGKEGQRTLLLLTPLLRLAEYLERSRVGRVRAVRAELEADRIRLQLEAESEPWVELVEVRKQASLVRQAYGKDLEVLWSSTSSATPRP